MFKIGSDFIRVALFTVSFCQIYLFAEATQDGYDKCLFFRTISSLRSPSKWDPLLAVYKQINDTENKYSDMQFKYLRSNMGKRSLSTLAKNDDMPVTHFQDGHADGENNDSSYRYDDVDKKVLNKMAKYLQHVKRRNNVQKPQSRDISISSDNSAKDTLDTFLQKFSGSDVDSETFENLRNINNLLQQAEVYCDHNEIFNDKDKMSLAFNCIIKRYSPYDTPYNDRLNTLKEKLQDADFLSIILNGLNNEQAMQMLKTFYPRVDKRFMGRIPEMGPRFTTPPTRRHGR